MDKKKIIIISVVLATFVLLYLLAMTAGLAQGKGQTVSIDRIKSSAAGMIDGLLGGFAPQVRLAGLKCDGQSVRSEFVMSPDHAFCDIDLEGHDDRFQAARLKILTPGATVYLRSAKPEEGAQFKPPCVDDLPSRSLEVFYLPKGEDEPGNRCWIRQKKDTETGLIEDLRITVLPEGGTLQLRCEDCDGDQPYSVRLKME